jgi:hypothetical protein
MFRTKAAAFDDFRKRMLHRMRKTHGQLGNKIGNNILVSGIPSTGKNYILDQLFEMGYDKGYVRYIDVRCPEIKYLREACKRMFPNPYVNPQRHGTLPAGYPFVVLMPIAYSIRNPFPKDLPHNFIPYTIGADSLGPYALRMLFGSKDSEKYGTEYDKFISSKKRTSYYDLKNFLKAHARRKVLFELGFYNEEWTPTEGASNLEKSFRRNLGRFNVDGIFSSNEFDLRLENILAPLMLNRINIIFYQGHLQDEWKKNFVVVHAIETLFRMSDRMRDMPFRQILHVREAQDMLKPESRESISQHELIMNAFFRYITNSSRHSNIDVWMDTKPNELEKTIVSKFHTHIVTRITDSKAIQDMFQGSKHHPSAIETLMSDRYYDREYGFFEVTEAAIPKWKDGSVEKQGLRWITPIRSMDDNVPVQEVGEGFVKNMDFSYFYEHGFRKVLTKPALDALKADWLLEEEPAKEAIRKAPDEQQEAATKPGQKIALVRKASAIAMWNYETRGMVLADIDRKFIGEVQRRIGETLGVDQQSVRKYLENAKKEMGITEKPIPAG